MTLNYTAHRDPVINNVIQRHIEIILEEIRKGVKSVDSILLSGGFGRGEGSVIRLPTGRIVPINDYDIYVLSNAKTSRVNLHSIRNNIHRRIDVELELHNQVIPNMFHVDIQFIRSSKLSKLSPDMSTYGLLIASRVVYGKDLRSRIPVRREDIPIGAGINPLFLAALGLIQNFEPEYIRLGVPEGRVPRFNYECYKAYVAISTALSYLCDSLELCHEKRARLMTEVYASKFPELAERLPDLPQRIEYYTNLKLRSLDFCEEKDPVKLWFEAKNDLEQVLQYSICKLIRKPFNTLDFSAFLLRNIKDIDFSFFEPYISYLLRRRRLPCGSNITKILIPIVRLFLSSNYVQSYYKLNKKLFLKPFRCISSPVICIYLSGVILLSSVSVTNRRPNRTQSLRASGCIRFLYPCDSAKEDGWILWRALRDACIISNNTIGREEKIAL